MAPRSDFSLDRVREMGHEAMRAAIERGVEDMAYAPIARDQGVTSIGAADVAAAFVEGGLGGVPTEQRANPGKVMALKHVTCEAGPAFLDKTPAPPYSRLMTKPLMCPPELLSLDLAGKTFLVTGGNSGIGRVTVRQLASQGAHVVLACRRPAEGERARADIAAGSARASVEVAALDLADLDSVRAFASAFLASHRVLHGLVNNAGVMNTPRGKTKNGFETQLGTNHLGHFLLTELLLGALRAGAPSRIVNVSSCFHDIAMGRKGHLDLEDLQFERRKYDGWEAYAQSKLANVLHARQLAKRLDGTGVTVASVHPGWVRTNLARASMPIWVQDYLLRPVLRVAGMIEPWEGTQTTLFALLSPNVPKDSGAYFSQLGRYRDKGANRGGWPLVSPNPEAKDDALAARLEVESRKLVGLPA